MPNPVTQILVVMNDDKTVGVQGPVDETMLCLGILEMAKIAIVEHRDKSKKLIHELPAGTHLRQNMS